MRLNTTFVEVCREAVTTSEGVFIRRPRAYVHTDRCAW
jgi:hypothetical protein